MKYEAMEQEICSRLRRAFLFAHPFLFGRTLRRLDKPTLRRTIRSVFRVSRVDHVDGRTLRGQIALRLDPRAKWGEISAIRFRRIDLGWWRSDPRLSFTLGSRSRGWGWSGNRRDRRRLRRRRCLTNLFFCRASREQDRDREDHN